MGTNNIAYAAAALAIALIFLFLGFLWGRSKVKSRVEDVLEKQRPALAAREFTLRQQLDDAIVEIARLRPVAEELALVQERLKNERTKHERMEAEFSRTGKAAASPEGTNEKAGQPQKPRVTAESADEAIKKLLKSLEKFNQPAEQRHEQPKPPKPAETAAPAKQPVLKEPILPPIQEKKPNLPPSPERSPQAADDWQEFARSLDAYRKTDPPAGAKKR